MSIRIRGKISGALLFASLACVAQFVAAQPDINDAPKGANPPAAGRPPMQIPRQTIATNLLLLKADGTPFKSASLSGTFKGKTGGSRSGWFSTNGDGVLTFTQFGIIGRPDTTLPTGPQSIYLSAPGEGAVVGENIEVKAADGAPVSLRLTSGGTIQVTAREADGARAIGGADVNLSFLTDNEEPVQEDVFRAYRGLRVYGDNWTRDGDGVREVKNLFPGRYLVSVSAMGLEYSEWAQEITIVEGQTVSINADLKRSVPTSFQLRVEDADGKPVADTEVEFYLRLSGYQALSFQNAGSLKRTLRTDAQGRCTLYPIRPGRWQISSMYSRAAGMGNIHIRAQEIEIPATGGTAVVVVQTRNLQIINR